MDRLRCEVRCANDSPRTEKPVLNVKQPLQAKRQKRFLIYSVLRSSSLRPHRACGHREDRDYNGTTIQLTRWIVRARGKGRNFCTTYSVITRIFRPVYVLAQFCFNVLRYNIIVLWDKNEALSNWINYRYIYIYAFLRIQEMNKPFIYKVGFVSFCIYFV